jgi:hypothetical protein
MGGVGRCLEPSFDGALEHWTVGGALAASVDHEQAADLVPQGRLQGLVEGVAGGGEAPAVEVELPLGRDAPRSEVGEGGSGHVLGSDLYRGVAALDQEASVRRLAWGRSAFGLRRRVQAVAILDPPHVAHGIGEGLAGAVAVLLPPHA